MADLLADLRLLHTEVAGFEFRQINTSRGGKIRALFDRVRSAGIGFIDLGLWEQAKADFSKLEYCSTADDFVRQQRTASEAVSRLVRDCSYIP